MLHGKSIVIIGKYGQLAWELARQLNQLSVTTPETALNIYTLSPSDPNNYIDLSRPESIHAAFSTLKADVIINTAAYTAVDKAEQEPELAMAINGIAPGILAEIAAKQGALFIHYSTDYVFDGKKQAPYTEEDVPVPLNTYGKTKLAGENAVEHSAARYFIFRTSWVYGSRGKNFLQTITRLANERDTLSIVNDQTGAPTSSNVIAEMTVKVLQQTLADTSKQTELTGLYHLTSHGVTNWHEFAAEILHIKGLDSKVKLKAITTKEFPTPAIRPAYSVLDSSKLERVFNLKLPDWRESLQQCLKFDN